MPKLRQVCALDVFLTSQTLSGAVSPSPEQTHVDAPIPSQRQRDDNQEEP